MLNSTTGDMNEATVGDNSDVYENVDQSMSFENLHDDAENDQGSKGSIGEDNWGEEKEEEDEGEKLGSEALKLLNDSDGTEESDKKAAKKEEKEEEDKEVQEKEEPEELTEEEKLEAASEEAGKKLRIKIGDEHFSLDSNAKMKVKIDGENQEVSVQELINNYSGKTAWDKKFTEIGQEKKVLQQEKQTLVQEKEEIRAKLAPVFAKLKDPLSDPFEALELLVDIAGQDSYAFYKRSLETRLDELVNLSSMSEVEQEAYFLKKQNERLLKSNEKRISSEQDAQKSKQLRDHVDQIRQAYGVSVDQYSEAFDELKSLMPDAKLTHESVVDYASIKPLSNKVESILKPYIEEINDSDYWNVVTQLSRSLRDGKLSEQQIQKIVKDEYGISSEVKELNTKLNIGKGKQPQKKIEEKSDTFESFADFE